MQFRDITLIQSSITNGRIYFPITDAKFFPADSLSDREGQGHTGTPVVFIADAFLIQSSIRVYSGQRLSPQKTFAKYLASIGAQAGDRLRITRQSERNYLIERLAA